MEESSKQIYLIKTTGSNSGIGVAILAAIIIFAFYFWLTYASADSIITEQKRASAFSTLFCPTGQCPTDMITGEKICPPSDEKYAYNPLTQVCSNPTSCSGTFPYAIQSDGSTSSLGICGRDPQTNELINCRCSQQSACPNYITSLFQSISGNPYTSLEGTRVAFSQATRSDYGGSVRLNMGNTMQFVNPNNTFCEVPLAWVLRSEPGCSSVSNEDQDRIPYLCMDLNPCLQGTLAYVVNDSTGFSNPDLYNSPIACIYAPRIDGEIGSCQTNPAPGCTPGYHNIPVYDRGYGGIRCMCDIPD